MRFICFMAFSLSLCDFRIWYIQFAWMLLIWTQVRCKCYLRWTLAAYVHVSPKPLGQEGDSFADLVIRTGMRHWDGYWVGDFYSSSCPLLQACNSPVTGGLQKPMFLFSPIPWGLHCHRRLAQAHVPVLPHSLATSLNLAVDSASPPSPHPLVSATY